MTHSTTALVEINTHAQKEHALGKLIMLDVDQLVQNPTRMIIMHITTANAKHVRLAYWELTRTQHAPPPKTGFVLSVRKDTIAPQAYNA